MFPSTIEAIIVQYGDLSKMKRRATVTPEIVVDDIQVLTINNQPVAGQ